MAIRALPALLLILFLPHLIQAYEADYLSSPEADYISLPPTDTHILPTAPMTEAGGFNHVLFQIFVRNAVTNDALAFVQSKLGTVGQPAVDGLLGARKSLNAKRSAAYENTLCGKTIFTDEEVYQAFEALPVITKTTAEKAYAAWQAANPALVSDMQLWVWETRSDNEGAAILDYRTQDAQLLEETRLQMCNTGSLEAMDVYDAADAAEGIIK